MWYDSLIRKNSGYDFRNGILGADSLHENENLTSYRKMGGTDFFSRTKIPGTHSYFDTQVLYHHLETIFKNRSPEVILDLGCGDGRGVSWFLQNTSANIIAVDGTLSSLDRLKKNYLDSNSANGERVLLVHANILDVPLTDECCDALYTFEALCFLLQHYSDGIRECKRLLRRNGLLINADRTKEYGMLYELLNRGPSAMITAFEKSELYEICIDQELRSSLFTDNQVYEILSEQGFQVLDKMGISFFSILLSFLKGEGKFVTEIDAEAKRVAEMLIKYSDSYNLHRTTIFVSMKG